MPDIISISDKSAGLVGRFQLVDVTSLRPSPNNARKHTKTQIRALAKSIETFGFAAPILVDKGGAILAGHARFEAAKKLRLKNIPVIYLDHLNGSQARAYMLADNKLTDRSAWDEPKLALELKELSDLALDFDIEATGFEAPEIDFRVQSLEENVEVGEDFELPPGPATSVAGDIWHSGATASIAGTHLSKPAMRT
jgi:ParB-like chromosome segregation protein Spo0J